MSSLLASITRLSVEGETGGATGWGILVIGDNVGDEVVVVGAKVVGGKVVGCRATGDRVVVGAKVVGMVVSSGTAVVTISG